MSKILTERKGEKRPGGREEVLQGHLCLLADAPSSHTRKWVIALAERGWQVDVLSLRPAEIPGAKVHLIPALTGTKLDAILRARWVRKKINALQPDFLHAHYATSYGVLGALSKVHPFVISVWGSDVFSFPRQSFLHRNLLKWILSKADVLCSTSKVMAEETRRYSLPGQPIHITPFGVDTALFAHPSEPEQEAEGGQVIFGVAKNLHSIYGLDILLQAFARLNKLRPGQGKIRIAGDGPERPALEALGEELGISDNIEWVGALPNEEVAAFYQGLDVVVVPSRQERFGVTAVEGMACGKPVIASQVGGLPEIIRDHETGLLIRPEQVEELAEAMVTLLDHPDLRRKMGRAGREDVLRDYDWQQNVSVMEDIYRQL